MFRKLLVLGIVLGFLGGVLVSQTAAQEVAIESYEFKSTIAKEGDVKLEFMKTQAGYGYFLSRWPHGKLQTLMITPGAAKNLGIEIMKTPDYLLKQKEGVRQRYTDMVEVGEYRVTFTSLGGDKFEVIVDQKKTFTAKVVMKEAEAVAMGSYLARAEEIAAYLNSHVNP